MHVFETISVSNLDKESMILPDHQSQQRSNFSMNFIKETVIENQGNAQKEGGGTCCAQKL